MGDEMKVKRFRVFGMKIKPFASHQSDILDNIKIKIHCLPIGETDLGKSQFLEFGDIHKNQQFINKLLIPINSATIFSLFRGKEYIT